MPKASLGLLQIENKKRMGELEHQEKQVNH
jgi:hypothetical protein